MNAQTAALQVIAQTAHIREYLERTDPKALEQIRAALPAEPAPGELPPFRHLATYETMADMRAAAAAAGYTETKSGKYFIKPKDKDTPWQRQFAWHPVYPVGRTEYIVYSCDGYSIPANEL